MKKLLYIFLSIFGYINNVLAVSKTQIDPKQDSIINVSWGTNAFNMLDTIFKKITSHIFSVLALIIIGVFIYIWFLFITSDWDEAQFKKAWKTLVYTIIWIVIIILSWWAVKLMTTIGI